MPNTSVTTPQNLTRPDIDAECDLLELLLREVAHLCRHAAGPYRRAAATRVEQQLTQKLEDLRK